MFLPDFLFPPEVLKRRERDRLRRVAERRKNAVPWDPEMKWVPELNIQAATYKVRSLFDVEPMPWKHINEAESKYLAVSPAERWAYCEGLFLCKYSLRNMNGRRDGSVVFDDNIVVPRLHQRNDNKYANGRWNDHPLMSLTPMEIMTLRVGTHRAKGSVIVAGLGLGHQLIEVSKRKQVKKLTLVEIDRELVDWLMPRVKPHLQQEVDVVIGDAYKVMPKMAADVALVDIFPGYGSNYYERDDLRRSCRDIKFIWAWGCAELPDSIGW